MADTRVVFEANVGKATGDSSSGKDFLCLSYGVKYFNVWRMDEEGNGYSFSADF